MKKRSLCAIQVILAALATGCASPNKRVQDQTASSSVSKSNETYQKTMVDLKVEPTRPFKDRFILSASTPSLAQKKFLVITEKDESDISVDSFDRILEQSFIQAGIPITNPEKAKRLVEDAGEFDSRAPISGKFQNIDKTLEAASKSGVDYIIQARIEIGDTPSLKRLPKKTLLNDIIRFTGVQDKETVWTSVVQKTVDAYFIRNYSKKSYDLANASEYRAHDEEKFLVASPKIFYSGRILNAKNEELLGSFEYQCSTLFLDAPSISVSVPFEFEFEPAFYSSDSRKVRMMSLQLGRKEYILAPDQQTTSDVVKPCFEKMMTSFVAKLKSGGTAKN